MDARTSLRLQRLRVERGLSLDEVARELGVPASLVNAWESGTEDPSVEQQERLAGFYGMTVGELFSSAPQVPSRDAVLAQRPPLVPVSARADSIARVVKRLPVPVLALAGYLVLGAMTGLWVPGLAVLFLALPWEPFRRLVGAVVYAQGPAKQRGALASLCFFGCLYVYLALGAVWGLWSFWWIVVIGAAQAVLVEALWPVDDEPADDPLLDEDDEHLIEG